MRRKTSLGIAIQYPRSITCCRMSISGINQVGVDRECCEIGDNPGGDECQQTVPATAFLPRPDWPHGTARRGSGLNTNTVSEQRIPAAHPLERYPPESNRGVMVYNSDLTTTRAVAASLTITDACHRYQLPVSPGCHSPLDRYSACVSVSIPLVALMDAWHSATEPVSRIALLVICDSPSVKH